MSNVVNLADYRAKAPAFEPNFVVTDPAIFHRNLSPLDRIEIVVVLNLEALERLLPLAQAMWCASAEDAAIRVLRPAGKSDRIAARWPGLSVQQESGDGWCLDVVLTCRRAQALVSALQAAGVPDRTFDQTATG